MTIYGTGIVLAIFVSYICLLNYVEKNAKKAIDHSIDSISSFVQADYENLRVDLIKRNVYLQNLALQPSGSMDKIIIDELILYKCKIEQGIPINFNIALNGINFNLEHSLLKKINPFLNKMGYNNIKANFQCQYIVDAAREIFTIKILSLGARGVGQLKLNINLTEFNLPEILSASESTAELASALSVISIAYAKLEYNDNSLIKRLINVLAEGKKESADEFIKEIGTIIKKDIGEDETRLNEKALQTFQDYLKKPGKIIITASPDTPVPLSRFVWVNNSFEIMELLKISIEI